jgi:hypothetical protein
LTTIRQKTFKKQTICHGFRATGIVPFNPQIIIENLEDYRWPETPLDKSSSGLSQTSTPKTVDRFKIISRKLLHLEAMSAKYTYILGKLTKGSITQAHLLRELQRDLAATTAA